LQELPQPILLFGEALSVLIALDFSQTTRGPEWLRPAAKKMGRNLTTPRY